MTDWMLKKKRPLAAGFIAAGALCFVGQASAAEEATDTFQAEAELVLAMSMSCSGNLDFGTIYRHTGMALGEGEITVAAASSATAVVSNAGDRIASVADGESVTCTVSNVKGETEITLEGADGAFNSGANALMGITLDGPGASDELTADVNLSTGSINEDGTFHIGGVLTVDGPNADGSYTSDSITVTLTGE